MVVVVEFDHENSMNIFKARVLKDLDLSKNTQDIRWTKNNQLLVKIAHPVGDMAFNIFLGAMGGFGIVKKAAEGIAQNDVEIKNFADTDIAAQNRLHEGGYRGTEFGGRPVFGETVPEGSYRCFYGEGAADLARVLKSELHLNFSGDTRIPAAQHGRRGGKNR